MQISNLLKKLQIVIFKVICQKVIGNGLFPFLLFIKDFVL
jgi:hypothetical protein